MKKENTTPPTFLLINKPVGWTSFDAVNFIRKIARAKTNNKSIKVGHAGTLDPFATGLLIIGVGREATKKLDEFKNLPKTYVATVHLGATSNTFDSTGTITENQTASPVSKTELTTVLKNFMGPMLQTPPMFSAKKINGKKLYELARQGKTVERVAAPIEIYDLKLLEFAWPNFKIEVTCSAGTYIRTIAHEIGDQLGVGAYCAELVRTSIGPYQLADAQDPKTVDLRELQMNEA